MAPPSIRAIPRYYTHEIFFVDFFGDELIVTVTSTPSVIKRWIRDVVFIHRRSSSYHPLVVGVGVQWTHAGHYSPRPKNYWPPRQIHSSYAFLRNSESTFVGVWNHHDAKILKRCRHQLEIGQLLDVKRYVIDSECKSLRGRSFEKIVETCMGYQGVRLDRQISKSDWSVDNLCLGQILQASLDAFVCFKLGVSARLWEV
ncbi:hypothetical protein EUTSA_v10028212mg [Eutrema salsugineum]|uniref:3'-5' exonuclease domain-containing protein n=1 Tax=Eutrema salsugineum TaxID=72664 RepID=V4M4X6_EUTSA|nr:hypothetical protein EUTSA_v10028212mg [Eutrema salsugineum]